MNAPRTTRAMLGLALLLAASGGGAEEPPLRPSDVPAPLKAWVPWALDDVPDRVCTVVGDEAVCAWPGRLKLDLDAHGGTFAQDAWADRELSFRLPGDAQRWPQDVRLDGRPVPVVEADDGPTLRLPAGAHRLEGRFAWTTLPDSVPVPAGTAIVDLTLLGRTVALPARDEAGLLWLRREGAAEGGTGESLRLQVFRRIADGIPMWVETRLAIEASGKAREIQLAGALLQGTEATAVSGNLPARVDGKGTLRVQVRAGRFNVTVLARVEGKRDAFALPPPQAPWPDHEVWVFAGDETLRQVELSGPQGVDPSRTDLPEDWRALPAFLVGPGQPLKLAEMRRGELQPPPDTIHLAREMWLDLAGRDFTVRDTFTGAVHRTWRLDLLPPGVLGRVAVDKTDQLVTVNPDPAKPQPGVELRKAALALTADSRLPREGASLPAVGWSANVDELQTSLHLPPGWRVLGATGVDALPGAWITRWTLLGLFFVLIVAIGTGRLFGATAGAIALAAMVLTYGEADAPFLVWLSLLGAVALQRVVPAGRLASLARIWWLVSALVLALLIAPFAVDQIRGALFPQIMPIAGSTFDIERMGTARNAAMAPPPAGPAQNAPASPLAAEEAQKLKPRGYALTKAGREDDAAPNSYSFSSSNRALEQEPHAELQTGPGVPQWRWATYELRWSGPVPHDHRMRVYLLSPFASAILTVLRLALLLALAMVLVGGWPPRLRRARPSASAGTSGPEPGDVPSAPLSSAALVLAALLLLAGTARAEDPPQQGAAGPEAPSAAVLQELKARLTRPDPCRPTCVDTPDLVLSIAGEQLGFSAEVHAQAASAWALPGPAASWVPSVVRVDGQPAALARLEDGFLHVRLTAGVHRVEASGPAPAQDSVTLQFQDRPRRARANAPGWEVVGLREDGPAEASIQLTRRLSVQEGTAESSTYAPWLEVTRTLHVGVSWRIDTSVRRVSPLGAPVSAVVPLLSGEAPTETDVQVQDHAVVVSLSRDEAEKHWSSTLETVPRLTLTAPTGRPWSEVWRLQCGVVWECAAAGLVPVHHEREGFAEPEFRPWPGEAVTVSFAHPAGAPGQTLTFDAVSLTATPGVRLETVELRIDARSSREQALTLTLPTGADLQEVKVGGTARTVRAEGGQVHITVPPGAQPIELRWHQDRGMGLFYGMPRVGLPTPAVNLTQVLNLPENRWLLFVRGPSWGPAVLFWGSFLFVLLVAAALGRVPGSPLRTAEWLLLSLGLTQVPLVGAAVVAGFFLALSWRARRPQGEAVLFNLLQIVLVAWALLAGVFLYQAVETGLLLRPDMQVAGNDSIDRVLRWYSDRVVETTPAAGVLSLPLWVYRGAMLAWALWLAASLVRWLGWAWRSWTEAEIWRPSPRRAVRQRSPVPPSSSDPSPSPEADA